MDRAEVLENMGKIVTVGEAEASGVSMECVNVCRKLRRLAKLDRLKVDTEPHAKNGGRNTHLFPYIEYCGYTVPEYVKNYLSNLQPFMLRKSAPQEYEKTVVCVLDDMYKVSLYIKADGREGEEVVVSFHEDNSGGIARNNAYAGARRANRELVPVFAENFTAVNKTSGFCSGDVLVQRGLLSIPLHLSGVLCENGTFIVRADDIEDGFVEWCNTYLSELYAMNEGLDISDVDRFRSLREVSFTSFSTDAFSSVSLLVDNLGIQPDRLRKAAADLALVTYAKNLQLPEKQREELAGLLKERYAVSPVKGMDGILGRVCAAMLPDLGAPEELQDRKAGKTDKGGDAI